MRRPSRRSFFAALALLLVSCSGTVDTDRAATELLAADRAFAATSLEVSAAEAFARFLSVDALSLSHGSHAVSGRDNIAGDMSDGYTLAWDPEHAEVAASGEMGWTWGTYTLTAPQADGSESLSHGKYLNIWRKSTTGDWRVIADMGNKSPAPDSEQ